MPSWGRESLVLLVGAKAKFPKNSIKGNLLKRLESGWSIQMNKWQVINEYSYTYNVVGQKLTETWLNLQNNTLQPVNRSNYIYDASGRLDSIKNYQVFSGNWVYQYLITLDDSPEQQILQKGKYFNINPQGQATLSTQNFITPGPKIYTDQPALEEIKKFVPATQTFDPSERISNAYTLLPNGVVKGEYSIERYQNNNWETTRKIQGWMSKLNTVSSHTPQINTSLSCGLPNPLPAALVDETLHLLPARQNGAIAIFWVLTVARQPIRPNPAFIG